MADLIQLTDLDVITRYSIAVRKATAERGELIETMRADLAWLEHGAPPAAPVVDSGEDDADLDVGEEYDGEELPAPEPEPEIHRAPIRRMPMTVTPAPRPKPAKKAAASKSAAARTTGAKPTAKKTATKKTAGRRRTR